MLRRDKWKWILPHVEGKDVLDLGCVCHELDSPAQPGWLHGAIRRHAGSLIGVDIVAGEVAEMNRRGFVAVCADVQTMQLGKTFDVIVAGDIIEHLAAPGALLCRASEHLRPGGVLLVTTPNPVNSVRLLRALISGRVGANKEHTCWFTAKTLSQLAERCGLEAVEESYVDDTRLYYRLWPPLKDAGGPARRAIRRLRMLLKRLMWRPWLALNTLLCLARPALAETLCMAFRARQHSATKNE